MWAGTPTAAQSQKMRIQMGARATAAQVVSLTLLAIQRGMRVVVRKQARVHEAVQVVRLLMQTAMQTAVHTQASAHEAAVQMMRMQRKFAARVQDNAHAAAWE